LIGIGHRRKLNGKKTSSAIEDRRHHPSSGDAGDLITLSSMPTSSIPTRDFSDLD